MSWRYTAVACRVEVGAGGGLALRAVGWLRLSLQDLCHRMSNCYNLL